MECGYALHKHVDNSGAPMPANHLAHLGHFFANAAAAVEASAYTMYCRRLTSGVGTARCTSPHPASSLPGAPIRCLEEESCHERTPTDGGHPLHVSGNSHQTPVIHTPCGYRLHNRVDKSNPGLRSRHLGHAGHAVSNEPPRREPLSTTLVETRCITLWIRRISQAMTSP
jgi:hypothetical protein